MNNSEYKPCRKCSEPTHELATFPGGICLKCHETKFNAEVARTAGVLPRPDFTKAIRSR